MSLNDRGGFLGLTSETVSRELTQLNYNNIVVISGKGIVERNKTRLKRIGHKPFKEGCDIFQF